MLSAEDLNRLGGFARYKDVDGDGIPYRTLPGTEHPQAAYFTRGSGHNEKALYTERPEDYQNLMERLTRKFETARTLVPAPWSCRRASRRSASSPLAPADFAVTESRDQLKKEYGVETRLPADSRVSRSHTRCTTSSRRMTAYTSSSRIGTRRC